MKNRLFLIIAILAFAGIAWYAWVRWKQMAAANSGEAQLVQSSGDENSKVVMDKDEVDRLRAAADKPAVTLVQPAPSASANAIPTSDSIAPNPPNGMKFTGTGRYQLYRQGNLTWRLDTDNGHTCIIFATDEEWRKPRVASQGCGRD
ncbi:MAG: hypothetical protein P4L10_04735 [Acidobacteriaceae bacterium]|jgi:hypothetical protein|nr:hypothetical protein [Acidobacteriaceae bacterium]